MAIGGRRARQQETTNWLVGSALLLITAAIVATVAFYLTKTPEALDESTMCPADGAGGHYVLLVDATDPLNFVQRQAFEIVVRDLVEKRVPEGALLSVFALGEDFSATAKPLVELCNPGSGAGKSELTSNVRRLKQRYEERFITPLMEKTKALADAFPAKHSPILEMLQMVGLNGFRRHSTAGEHRLIIMSDMLHNTPSFSMYKGEVSYAPFSQTDYGRRVLADLDGVEVELHYLMNAPQLQTKRQLLFWEEYFAACGARIVLVRPLEG